MRQTHPPAEVVVINNNPAQPPAVPAAPFPIRVITPPRDFVYCEAVNEGIATTRGAFVLVLNDDVQLEAEYIACCVRACADDPGIGMVSGKLIRPDGVTLDSAGLMLTYWRTARDRGYGTSDRGQYECEEEVFGVNGAAAWYRRVLLEQIREDGFYCDPAYRIFYEDLDIAWRAQRRGWRAWYVPAARAIHARGLTVRSAQGTGRRFARRFLSDERYFDLVKNRWYTIARNESAASALLHAPGIAAYECMSMLVCALTRPRLIKRLFSQIPLIFARISHHPR